MASVGQRPGLYAYAQYIQKKLEGHWRRGLQVKFHLGGVICMYSSRDWHGAGIPAVLGAGAKWHRALQPTKANVRPNRVKIYDLSVIAGPTSSQLNTPSGRAMPF